jgi:hypothetical protein
LRIAVCCKTHHNNHYYIFHTILLCFKISKYQVATNIPSFLIRKQNLKRTLKKFNLI